MLSVKELKKFFDDNKVNEKRYSIDGRPLALADGYILAKEGDGYIISYEERGDTVIEYSEKDEHKACVRLLKLMQRGGHYFDDDTLQLMLGEPY